MTVVLRAHSQPTEDVPAYLLVGTTDELVSGPERSREKADRETRCDGLVVTAPVTTTRQPPPLREARCLRGAQGGSR